MGFFKRLRKAISGKSASSVETVETVKKSDFPEVKPSSTKDLLRDWSKTIEMVEKHPLSQARVINTAVLSDLTSLLHNMNEKLDRLSKLDDIYSNLIEIRKQFESKGMPTRSVDEIIDNIKGLTLKDQDALKILKAQALTTEDFADKASLSRSTASSRLNKLYSMGLLEKLADGKKILYKTKQ